MKMSMKKAKKNSRNRVLKMEFESGCGVGDKDPNGEGLCDCE
jgi:hypothetical protein